MLKTSIIIFLFIMKFVYVCIDDSLSAFRQKDLKRKPSHSGVSPVFFSRCEWIVSELGDGYNLTFIFFHHDDPEKENGQGKDYPYTPKKDGQFYYRSVQSQRKLSINTKACSTITLAIKGNSGRTNAINEPLYFRGSMFDPGG